MIFLPDSVELIVSGRKTQTRRPVKAWEMIWLKKDGLLKPRKLDDVTAVYSVSMNGRHLRWKAGKDYALCPGRGKKQIARIFLKSIRCEPLDDISHMDAIAEGLDWNKDGRACYGKRTIGDAGTLTDAYLMLWQSMYGDYDPRDLVWVLDFEFLGKASDKYEDMTLLEGVSYIVHDVWCDWMKYEHDTRRTDEDRTRWKRQQRTPYFNLTDEEKKSDQRIAKRYINEVQRVVLSSVRTHMLRRLEQLRKVWTHESAARIDELDKVSGVVEGIERLSRWTFPTRAKKDDQDSPYIEEMLVYSMPVNLCSRCGTRYTMRDCGVLACPRCIPPGYENVDWLGCWLDLCELVYNGVQAERMISNSPYASYAKHIAEIISKNGGPSINKAQR